MQSGSDVCIGASLVSISYLIISGKAGELRLSYIHVMSFTGIFDMLLEYDFDRSD